MTYAFTFDASSCSGCKACQEACKDKNGLPAGILWRRVIEVSGGDWQPTGEAWENTIFAYNLSVACNHCTHAKCAGVCPTDAYTVRPDGIVLLDASKCMGCGYCTWACPYGAPQYDRTQGIVTKCDFCYDNLDAGLPPTCVASCPLRVLEYSSLEELSVEKTHRNLWQLPGSDHPYPLPLFSRTEPHLSIKLHPGMDSKLEKQVNNREEILPPGSIDHARSISAAREVPLVAFTLLTQMAVGIAACGILLYPLPLPLLFAIGLLLGVGGCASFLHLGRKRNAWRAIIHLRKSWLSRELLMSGLFGAAWAGTLAWQWSTKASPSYWPMTILGLGMVYAMSRVYRLRAVPSWNTWHTQAAFFLSTVVLGVLGVNLLIPQQRWLWLAGVALAAELAMLISLHPKISRGIDRLRVGLILLGIFGIMALIDFHSEISWPSVVVFSLALLEEIIGRWQFYASRVPFPFHDE